MKIDISKFFLTKPNLVKLEEHINRNVLKQALANQLRLIIITGCRPCETLSYKIVDKTVEMIVAKKRDKVVIRKIDVPNNFKEYRKRYTTRTIQTYFKKLFSITAREYRHIFATRAYRKTKDIFFVQQLLYHSNVDVTKQYIEQYKDPLKSVWK